MTTSIVYDGTADFQEFAKEDFAKENVDAKKVSFPKGHVVEVDDSVAELLLEGKGVFNGYKFREPKKDDVGYTDPEDGNDTSKQAKADENQKIDTSNEQADKAVDPDTTGPGAALQESTGDTGTAGMPGAGGGRTSTT